MRHLTADASSGSGAYAKPMTIIQAALARTELALRDIAATNELAAQVARLSAPGDVIGLSGDLGAGKTTFARAFIEARAAVHGEPVDEVPSPTFTLVQVYELDSAPVWHFDLYRLERAEDAYELGIEDAFAAAISLIEWPERIEALLPEDRLELEFLFAGAPESRRIRLAARGSWALRLPALKKKTGP